VEVRKPRWTTSSFLLYAGAFTVLAAATAAYAYLSNRYGDAAFAGWTLLMLAVLGLIGVGLRRRGAWIAGGLFAYLAVTAFGTFVGALFTWWGWGGESGASGPFDGQHWVEWLLVVLVVTAAAIALRRFGFPLLVLPIATLVWFLVTDVVSGGGSWSAAVTLLVGIAYFFAGLGLDRVRGFWVQVVAGLLVGGSLLYWWHSSTADWWLVVVTAFVFMLVGTAVRRSSWAVLGAAGLLAAATHFSIDWTTGSYTSFGGMTTLWKPIVTFAVTGFLLVLMGLLAARRREPAG
jgi:hypothetical protein